MERESPTPEQAPAPEAETGAAVRPTGRDEIRSAVLREARRLFSERGPQVPLRDIADAAGVNLGLIHRHIGRKDALITAVMQDAVRFGAARLENTDDAGEAVHGMLLGASSHPEISRLLAWLALDRDAAFPPMVDPSQRPAAALRRMNAMFGIQLEGTYTGKTLAALLAAAEKTSGKTFLFWNTLNSRPSPDGLENIDYRTLPTGFHSYFETPVQPLDR